jgi:hypothetical protein
VLTTYQPVAAHPPSLLPSAHTLSTLFCPSNPSPTPQAMSDERNYGRLRQLEGGAVARIQAKQVAALEDLMRKLKQCM